VIASPSRSHLLSTAFLNPDGSVAVIVMNQGNTTSPVFLWVNGKAVKVNSRAHSMSTYIIK
jgi:glucosylceramidase